MSTAGNSTEGLDFGECIDLDPPRDEKARRLSVVIDGVRTEIETVESFAIKFGLLTNMPVTKVRHIVSRTPARVWTGTSPSKAKGLLSLIEEAGGTGRIVSEEVRVERPETARDDAPGGGCCSKCGFPLKKDDGFCQFCMSPVSGVERRISRAPRLDGNNAVPPTRMLFYLLVLFAAVVITIVFRS